jgi:ThiF family
MALAPFFDRVFEAVGGHLRVSRESLTSALGALTVGVDLGLHATDNDLWIAELTINLLARLYPRIAITGAAQQLDDFRRLATSINPQLELTDRPAPVQYTVHIGPIEMPGSLHASASGWVAHLSHRMVPPRGKANPYSAGAAACLACAELFRRVFLSASVELDVSVSLIDYGATAGSEFALQSMSIASALYVGIGAVGNAGLWALSRHRGLRGQIALVDPEAIELSNLQRYVLATNEHIGIDKVTLAEQALANSQLNVTSFKSSLESLAGRPDVEHPATTVISVDNVEGRRAAQALLPRLVINGWTGDEALGASWHHFGNGVACLACLYHPHGQGVSATEQAAKIFGLSNDRAAQLWVTRQPLNDSDIRAAASSLAIPPERLRPWRGKPLGDLYTDVACGAVALDVTGVGKIESVPLAHQSALAGILMASELVLRTNGRLSSLAHREPLVSWDNVLRGPPSQWLKPRAQEPGCICTDSDYQTVYLKKWSKALKPRVRRD